MDTGSRGVTLLEAMAGLAILGILLGLVFGTVGRWADRARVDLAAGQLLDAYRRAQAVARAWGRPAELVVTPDSLVVRAVWHSESTEVWRAAGPSAAGVALTPSVHVAQFQPSGVAGGIANVTHVLTRGAITRRVVVSRLGRVRVG